MESTVTSASWKFKAKLSYCEIWQNIYDQTIAQAYLLPSSYLKNQEKIYQLRKGKNIVQCLGIVYLNDNRYIGDGYVLIERITNRLSNLKTLTQTQTLKVLYKVYSTLKEQNWPQFWLSQNCICFNTDGMVKIWKNPDLWNNHKSKLRLQTKYEKNSQTIKRLLRIVETKCINSNILKMLKPLERQTISFEQAASIVLKVAENLFIDIREGSMTKIQQNVEKIPKLNFNYDDCVPKYFEENKPKRSQNNCYFKGYEKTSIYEPIKIQDESFEKFFSTQYRKYESTPCSPQPVSWKNRKNKKQTKGDYQQNHNTKHLTEDNQHAETDFMSFGILDEKDRKNSFLDVKEMQRQLMKFTKKQQYLSKQVKFNSEHVNNDFSFNSGSQIYPSLTQRKMKKGLELFQTPKDIKKNISNYESQTYSNKRETMKPFLKDKGRWTSNQFYPKHLRHLSEYSNENQNLKNRVKQTQKVKKNVRFQDD